MGSNTVIAAQTRALQAALRSGRLQNRRTGRHRRTYTYCGWHTIQAQSGVQSTVKIKIVNYLVLGH